MSKIIKIDGCEWCPSRSHRYSGTVKVEYCVELGLRDGNAIVDLSKTLDNCPLEDYLENPELLEPKK